jgi:hypothetical protein
VFSYWIGGAVARTRSETVGYVIVGILAVVDATTFAQGSGDDAPPFLIALVSTILGLVTLGALYLLWSRRKAAAADRRMVMTVLVSRAASAVFSIPAFFVDIPGVIKVLVAVFIVLTVVGIQLVRPELERAQRAA